MLKTETAASAYLLQFSHTYKYRALKLLECLYVVLYSYFIKVYIKW